MGLARTLRYVPNREDLFKTHGGGFNAQKRAIDSVDEGEILVMEARGEKGTGTVGDILALRAQVRGAAAIITDGGVRDFYRRRRHGHAHLLRQPAPRRAGPPAHPVGHGHHHRLRRHHRAARRHHRGATPTASW